MRRVAAGLARPAAIAAWLAATSPVPALAAVTPNDPFYPQQWNLAGATSAINAAGAWCVSTGSGIVVADIDTGADFSHEDLAGKLIAGAAFTGGSGNQTGTGAAAVQDDFGHGTMTTGLVVASTGNGRGIASVAPSARALVIKALSPDGTGSASGSSSDIAAGIDYATQHHVQVINLSLGSDQNQQSLTYTATNNVDTNLQDAIHRAAQAGIAVALAAGNASSTYNPAILSNIAQDALIVGAVDADGKVASYSNTGSSVAIYAPGGTAQMGVVSTWWQPGKSNIYGSTAGTSLAAPLVAGTLANLMATGLTASAARQRIVSTAVVRNGTPELDAAAALGSPGSCPGTQAAAAGSSTSRAPAPKRSQPGPAGAGTTAAPAGSATSPAPSAVAQAVPSANPSSAPAVEPAAIPGPSHRITRFDPRIIGAGVIGLVLVTAGLAFARWRP